MHSSILKQKDLHSPISRWLYILFANIQEKRTDILSTNSNSIEQNICKSVDLAGLGRERPSSQIPSLHSLLFVTFLLN